MKPYISKWDKYEKCKKCKNLKKSEVLELEDRDKLFEYFCQHKKTLGEDINCNRFKEIK